MSTFTKEFTKEQLTGIIEAVDDLNDELENDRKCHGMAGNKITEKWDYLNDRAAPPEVVKRLARIALASLEAEAVHQVLTGDAWVDLSKGAMESQKRVGAIVRTLYAAQPVLVAPDLKELEAILDWILMLPCPTPKATHFAKRLAVVIDTCRAAMLQGAEPVTTAYKLPGDFESFISWLTSGDGIPDWLINGDKLDDEKVSFLLKIYRAGGKSPVIPDGWVMVPIEPTVEMIAAAMLSDDVLFDTEDDTMFRVQHGVIWQAMLAAAPQQEVK